MEGFAAVLAARTLERRKKPRKPKKKTPPQPRPSTAPPRGGDRNRGTKQRAKPADNTTLEAKLRDTARRTKAELAARLAFRKVKGHSGDIWNELADGLAAIGRTIATGRTPQTDEVNDRLNRAIEAIGHIPDVTLEGFSFA